MEILSNCCLSVVEEWSLRRELCATVSFQILVVEKCVFNTFSRPQSLHARAAGPCRRSLRVENFLSKVGVTMEVFVSGRFLGGS